MMWTLKPAHTLKIYGSLIAIIYKEFLKFNNKNQITSLRKWTMDLNKHFPKEHIQMVNKHLKRCSPSLTVREIQIKTMR